jgi:hypothetical protein
VFYLLYICCYGLCVFMHVYIDVVFMLYDAYHGSMHYAFMTG